MRDILYFLLRTALGSRPQADQVEMLRRMESFGQEDWLVLLRLSREQTLSALVCRGIGLLGDQVTAPESVAMAWVMDMERYVRRSSRVRAHAEGLVRALSDQGLHPLILKGPAVAAFYPEPDLRCPGDIDLYIPPDELEVALDTLRSLSCELKTTPDGSWFGTMDGVDIDLHTRYYDLQADPGKLPKAGSVEGTLLMLSTHVLKHAIGPGVGMRQICDVAMAIRHLCGSWDREVLLEAFRTTGTVRWHRILFSLIDERLGVAAGLFPEPVDFSSLEKILFDGGNFGHYGASRLDAVRKGSRYRKADTALRMLRKASFALRVAPRSYLRYLSQLVRGNLSLSDHQA